MWYVYYKHVKSGREDFCGVYDTPEEAVRHIAHCYNVDKGLNQLGEYYYFMKKIGRD